VGRFDHSNLFRRYQFRTIIHQSLVPLDHSFKSSNNDNHRPSKTRETSLGPSKASEEPCEVTLPQGKPRPLTNKKTNMVAWGKKRGRARQVPHKTGNGPTMAPLEKKPHPLPPKLLLHQRQADVLRSTKPHIYLPKPPTTAFKEAGPHALPSKLLALQQLGVYPYTVVSSRSIISISINHA
jgi:hypothetical protein